MTRMLPTQKTLILRTFVGRISWGLFWTVVLGLFSSLCCGADLRCQATHLQAQVLREQMAVL